MSPARGFLVTGTDTGIGKTFVGCALAAAFSEHLRVGVLKPAETGCREVEGELWPEDAVRLRDAAACDAPLGLVCPFRYPEPLAPWVAAERAGRPIDPAVLREAFEALAARFDVVLVESAGGLLVPVTGSLSFADLAADLGLEVLVVVGSRLGALNQTLLTLEVAAGRGLAVRGYVLNHLGGDADLAQQTNAATLARLARVPCLGTMPFVPVAATLPREDLAVLGRPLAAALLRA